MVKKEMNKTIGLFGLEFSSGNSRKFEGLYQPPQYSRMIDGRKLATEKALEKTVGYIKDAGSLKADIEKAKYIYKKQLEGLREELRKAVIEEGGK